jgi:hypothetical protein
MHSVQCPLVDSLDENGYDVAMDRELRARAGKEPYCDRCPKQLTCVAGIIGIKQGRATLWLDP